MSTKFNAKMSSSGDPNENSLSAEWWDLNPMTYDWDREILADIGSESYFRQIDENFGQAHSLVNNPQWPDGYILENFIPYDLIENERVLEIGCGAGLVSSHLIDAGAALSAIDIASNSIELTTTRLKLLNTDAEIKQMNAEQLAYKDQEFDRVVSWGVIHHSSDMEAIVQEIYRVLKPKGRAHIMIYNKDSIRYQIYARWWLGICKGKLLYMTIDQIVGSITDGYIARHLTQHEVKTLFRKFEGLEISYSDEPHTILKYLFGMARPLKPFYRFTRRFQFWLARRWGWYMQIVITKP